MDSTTQQIQARRDRAMGSGTPLFYNEPLHLVRGDGVYLYDPAGRRYVETNHDWRRSAEMWSKLVTEKVAKDGTVGLAFLGAGASTRRYVTRLLRDRLGLAELLEEAEAA